MRAEVGFAAGLQVHARHGRLGSVGPRQDGRAALVKRHFRGSSLAKSVSLS